MKRLAYLLILLVISAQVDDAWAVDPVLPSASLAEDNDEYLPARRRPGEELSFSRQEQALDRLPPQTANFSALRRSLPTEWDLTAPFAPSPLYVFMSLQM